MKDQINTIRAALAFLDARFGWSPGEAPAIDALRAALARALRVYLKRNGIDGIVRQSTKTDDGVPRVWLLRVFNKGART